MTLVYPGYAAYGGSKGVVGPLSHSEPGTQPYQGYQKSEYHVSDIRVIRAIRFR